MKITKSYLKQLIKEELKEAIGIEEIQPKVMLMHADAAATAAPDSEEDKQRDLLYIERSLHTPGAKPGITEKNKAIMLYNKYKKYLQPEKRLSFVPNE